MRRYLNDDERDGLTTWGRAFSAQMREPGTMALNIMPDAEKDAQGVVMLNRDDVGRLRELLDVADIRGHFRD